MNNVADIQNEREINTLIHQLGSVIGGNQDTIDRTFKYLEEKRMGNEQIVISVRLPESLVDRIEEHARWLAYQDKRRITRNSMIGEILEKYMDDTDLQTGKAHTEQRP
jgi:hypothetical protein